MKDMGIVQGSTEQAKNIIVGVDTVYVHTDIIQVTEDREGNQIEGLFKYHEIQYDKNEYIELISQKNNMLENQSTDIQLALADIMGGAL